MTHSLHKGTTTKQCYIHAKKHILVHVYEVIQQMYMSSKKPKQDL